MFCIQFLDHEEGSAARWSERLCTRRPTIEAVRELLRNIRREEMSATDYGQILCSYRIVEVDSDAYYSQPTDKLEY